MSRHPSTSIASIDIKTNFGTTFTAALKDYQKQTKRDITSHPLAAQLQSCDSPSAVLAVLRAQAQAFNQAQNADDKFTKWLDPTVNVLYAFSATLGNGIGLVNCETSTKDPPSDMYHHRYSRLRMQFSLGLASSSR